MTEPASDLRGELGALSPELRARLAEVGFSEDWLVAQAAPLSIPGADPRARRREKNQVRGEVRAPAPGEIPPPPEETSEEGRRLHALGEAALRRGEFAMCVMAGGMATRMGGVVKALVEVIPGKTFLDLRLAENAAWTRRVGRPVPLWLMTSDATDGPIRQALERLGAPAHVRTFRQGFGLRLTPDGHLFRDEQGQPSLYATGHGDVIPALRRSGLLGEFRRAGGRAVMITNLDNLGASTDPLLLGRFLESGAPLQVEVVPVAGDKGGYPVHAEGRLQVLEEFRLPDGFDTSRLDVFSVNTFWVGADELDTVEIAWHWFEVEKKVEGRVAIQFERLVQELTVALPSTYVQVPREGRASRFLPVKDPPELEHRRETIIEVARARGMLA